jgi:hypothetical protein
MRANASVGLRQAETYDRRSFGESVTFEDFTPEARTKGNTKIGWKLFSAPLTTRRSVPKASRGIRLRYWRRKVGVAKSTVGASARAASASLSQSSGEGDRSPQGLARPGEARQPRHGTVLRSFWKRTGRSNFLNA